MTKIKIEQGDGDEPAELVASIVAGQKYPFTATITHKAVKPLVVPSTGLCEVIAPGEAVSFKVKSFEQAWAVVTDSAALAKRYESEDDDFVVITVAVVSEVKEGGESGGSFQPPKTESEVETDPDAKKTTSKGAAKAATAASE
ncbi:hypothetical protein HZF02_32865 (plasmid) [Pseudomonas yamanorum]|nr:hypothetical protein HZF02_32865 [Pseudomonas yamanorum]